MVLRWNVAKGVFKGQQFFFCGENLPSVGCVVNGRIDSWMLRQRQWNAFEDGSLHAPHILIHDSTLVWMSLRLVLRKHEKHHGRMFKNSRTDPEAKHHVGR
ncbi:MAG: hypothetical protein CM15mP78_10180 [Candidatus Poseidoniales archaeon]|nr:MAG: hypothetical protein CM15mP78_10180 [Candidatus Poseidoniales archaeon]